MKYIFGVIIAASAFACPGVASASGDPGYCKMISLLAKKITEDRDKGVTYKAELATLKGAVDDQPGVREVYKVAQNIAKVVYVNMPNLTPDGAFKLHYVVCMGGK